MMSLSLFVRQKTFYFSSWEYRRREKCAINFFLPCRVFEFKYDGVYIMIALFWNLLLVPLLSAKQILGRLYTAELMSRRI